MSTTSIQLPFLQSDGLSRAGKRIALAVRRNQDLAVMIVLINNVERICASIGHSCTADLLDKFFLQLKGVARGNDAVERIGDRKFVVLLNGLRNRGHVNLAAQKISRIARETCSGQDIKADLETIIGVAMCPSHGDDAADLMQFAEIASLDGRRKNEDVCFFEKDSAQQLFLDWGMQKRLQRALENGELELHYQPKISIKSGQIKGAEALMRWSDPEIGPISPDVFISLAESTGQISELTDFAIQSACGQLSCWIQRFDDLSIAVNIAPRTIQNLDIVDVVKDAASIWGIDPRMLTLEVTENALMADPRASHNTLTRLRELGCRISIDDFGTGYSSLAYLKEIPADELKIDRSFVMGMMDDPGDFKIVEHTISIAKSFGLSVVAEGIESQAILDGLSNLNCDYAQGYFICKPVPAGDFESYYEEHNVAASEEVEI